MLARGYILYITYAPVNKLGLRSENSEAYFGNTVFVNQSWVSG